LQLESAKQHGWALNYLKNTSEAVQLAAVKQCAVQFNILATRPRQIQLAAVKNMRCINSIY
jgi:hypothetical protein